MLKVCLFCFCFVNMRYPKRLVKLFDFLNFHIQYRVNGHYKRFIDIHLIERYTMFMLSFEI